MPLDSQKLTLKGISVDRSMVRAKRYGENHHAQQPARDHVRSASTRNQVLSGEISMRESVQLAPSEKQSQRPSLHLPRFNKSMKAGKTPTLRKRDSRAGKQSWQQDTW